MTIHSEAVALQRVIVMTKKKKMLAVIAGLLVLYSAFWTNTFQGANFNTTAEEKNATATTKEINITIAEEKNITASARKHLIIHVGPPKTGTSSLECQLQVNEFLNSSKYVYLGQWEKNCPPSLLKKRKEGVKYHRMRQIVHHELLQKRRNGKQSRALRKSLDKLYARNTNAIVSSEAFRSYLNSKKKWKFLASFTEQIPHEVTFVMTYRRYFEWFFSSK